MSWDIRHNRRKNIIKISPLYLCDKDKKDSYRICSKADDMT